MSLRSKLIKVSSKHRTILGDSLSDFKTHIGHSHARETMQIVGLTLVSGVISNTEYNINSKNKDLVVDIGAGEVTITLPEGQYSTSTLITELNSQLGGTVVTQDSLTQKLVFTAGAVNPLSIWTDVDRPASTLSDTLGIYTSFSIAALGVATADRVIDLSGLDLVNVVSSNLAYGNSITTHDEEGSKNGDILATIPITTPWGTNTIFQDSSGGLQSSITYDPPRNINSIDICLTDKHNKPIEVHHHNVLIFRAFY